MRKVEEMAEEEKFVPEVPNIPFDPPHDDLPDDYDDDDVYY